MQKNKRSVSRQKKFDWLWGINLVIILYGVGVIYQLLQCMSHACSKIQALLFPFSWYVFISQEFLVDHIPVYTRFVEQAIEDSTAFWGLYAFSFIINFAIICLIGALLGILYKVVMEESVSP